MNTFLQLFTYIKQQAALRITTRSLFIIVLFMAGLIPDKAIGEGSKELSVTGSGLTQFYLCNDFSEGCNTGTGIRTQFAIFGCSENDRLNFTIESPDEVVYMGFDGEPNSSGFNPRHIEFRIKNSIGLTVYAQQSLPTSGIGFITNIGQAQAGPNQVVGVGGYDALEFAPGVAGTYYIEFDNLSNNTGNRVIGSFYMELIDITIFNTSTNLVETGRLYSKSWQFLETSEGGWDKNSSTFYIYSSDRIITSLEFDQLEGRAWLMFCNATGCANTGDFNEDRKSVYQEQAYVPEYNIFLNQPDPDLFPPAPTLGSIVDPPPQGFANCNDGSIDFVVNVDKAGNAKVSLDFDPPYVSTSVTQSVVVGPNTIAWDGNDGMGNPVPNSVGIEFHVTYINGLTNLPLYDIEGNPNGFRIVLVSPSGDPPLVFWDDSYIPGGTTNFTGCNSTPPNNGCHPFFNEDYGNTNTINTWWYSASTSSDTLQIVEQRTPELMVFNQVPPQEYCAGSGLHAFSVERDLNTDDYHWSFTGGDAIITPNPPSSPWQVTVNFGVNAVSGNLEVYGTNSNCTDPGPIASLPILITPMATADAGSDATICEGTSYTVNDATGTGTSYFWNVSPATHDGVLTGGSTLTPTYTPGPIDVANISVTLSLTAFSAACGASQADAMILSFDPAPTAEAGSYATLNVCENGSFSLDLASVNNSTSVQWSTSGDGVFVPDEFTIQPSYEPGVADAAAGTITLTLTANGDGVCTIDAQDFITLTIDPLPTANAGTYADNAVCETGTFVLDDASTTNNNNSQTWTTSGDGTFLPNASDPQPSYAPGANDALNGTVTLTLTAHAMGECPTPLDDATQELILNIIRNPTANTGVPPNAPICSNGSYPLSGTVTDEQSYFWSGGDGSFDDVNSLTATYTPGPGDIAANTVTLTLTAVAQSPCSLNGTDQITIPITKEPTVYAGLDGLDCQDVPFVILADATEYAGLTWVHTGIGTLDETDPLSPIYTPDPTEYGANGGVDFTLTAIGNAPCADVSSSMHLQINEGSYANAGTDELACAELSFDFTNSTIRPSMYNSQSIIWTVSGDPTGGSFAGTTNTDTVPVYNLGTNAVTYPVTLTFTMSVETPPFCQEFDEMELTVVDYQPGSVITGIQQICYNIVPSILEVTAPTGGVGTYNFQWQSSTDNITFTDIPGETGLTYQSIPSLTQTTYFRNVQSCDCGSKETPTITVNVWDEYLPGTKAPDEVICFGTLPQLLTGGAPTGGDGTYLYQWQSSTDNVTFTDIATATTLDYQPGMLTSTLYYRLRQTNTCGLVFTPTTTITVLDEFLPGAVSPDQDLCYNTQPALLSADPPTGGDGNYTYQWQNSTDNITFTDIPGATSLTYQPGLLTQTTYYRQDQICVCGTVTTATITVNVYPDFLVGSITGDQTICYNTVPGTMLTGTAPTGGDGNYTYQWQSSVNNVTFNNIGGANLIDYQPGALTTSTWFRLEQSSGSGCGTLITNTIEITVYNQFLAGTASGDQTICFNTIPALTLSATAPTGADGIYTYQWEKSAAGDPFLPISGATGLVYSEPNALQVTTAYRVVQTSSCGSVNTNLVTITVNDPPNVFIYSDMDIACTGADILFLGYSTSNPISWEWDFDDGTTFSGQNPPIHNYGFQGSYDVTLTVTDNIGCANTDTLTILVVEPPVVDFSYQVDTCHQIRFSDMSTPPTGYHNVSWYWELGDGNTHDDSTFTYEYVAGGLYNVTLTVTAERDSVFCTNTITLPVIVPHMPTIYYTWDPEPTCLGDSTHFYGTSGTEITEWYWNFGDGLNDTGQGVSHLY
ncbi:MAG: PKD domain-containing protein, partial [Bacteroidales bacterium]|nr:PKD domain-containing protein [Bacteroidales bacterium]